MTGEVIPRLDQVRYCEQSAQDDANPSYHHISDAQEGILPTHHRPRRDNDRFRAAIDSHIEIC